MGELLLMFVIFAGVRFITKSFIVSILGTLFIGAMLNIEIDTEKVQEGVAAIEKHLEKIDNTVGVTSEIVKITDGDTISITVTPQNTRQVEHGNIYDQLRNPQFVQWNGEQLCGDGIDCFTPRLRMHDDDVLYACQQEGINCYRLQE